MQEYAEQRLLVDNPSLSNPNVAKMSSASAAINVFKNQQTEGAINFVSKNEFSKVQQHQIHECFRIFNIDLRHIAVFKNLFMSCDDHQDGYITREALLREMHRKKLRVPGAILNFFINTLLDDEPS